MKLGILIRVYTKFVNAQRECNRVVHRLAKMLLIVSSACFNFSYFPEIMSYVDMDVYGSNS